MRHLQRVSRMDSRNCMPSGRCDVSSTLIRFVRSTGQNLLKQIWPARNSYSSGRDIVSSMSHRTEMQSMASTDSELLERLSRSSLHAMSTIIVGTQRHGSGNTFLKFTRVGSISRITSRKNIIPNPCSVSPMASLSWSMMDSIMRSTSQRMESIVSSSTDHGTRLKHSIHESIAWRTGLKYSLTFIVYNENPCRTLMMSRFCCIGLPPQKRGV